MKTTAGGHSRSSRLLARLPRLAGARRATARAPGRCRRPGAGLRANRVDGVASCCRRRPTGRAACGRPGRPAKRRPQARLAKFLDEALSSTAGTRPARRWQHVAPFTPPRLGAKSARGRSGTPPRCAARSAATEKFLAELGWREFAYHLLFHFGDLDRRNFRPEFDAFPGRTTATRSRRGSAVAPAIRSSTPACANYGTTGWMHNRVRMIVASFLMKDLLIDLAARRAMVLGYAGRCRSCEERARLAVGRRQRRRCRALFPRVQPRAAGREVRSARATTCAAGCPSSPSLRPRRSTAHGPPTRSCLPKSDPTRLVDHSAARVRALEAFRNLSDPPDRPGELGSMKIAVIGAGVAGLGAAWPPSRHHDVVVYEREDRFGGHFWTVDAPTPAGRTPSMSVSSCSTNATTQPRGIVRPSRCAHRGIRHVVRRQPRRGTQRVRSSFAVYFAQRRNVVRPPSCA